MTVLDTDFLIAVERNKPGALDLAANLVARGEPLRVPASAWLEYLAGVNPGRRPMIAEALRRAATLHAFGNPEVEEAVRLHGELRASGRPLAWHDLQVAATATLLGEPLVSSDQAFRGVPQLKVVRF